MFEAQEAQIAALLFSAAKSRGTCSFQQVFSLFPQGTAPSVVYGALEKAARRLAPSEVANYTALMAKKDSGCPGDGFFDTFKIKRPSEYEQIAGQDTFTLDLTQEQRKQITRLERARVYAHASTGQA